ncbi:CDN_1a_G0005690.mRNA.1.CDS.1 [Saccharomyces cerevisiae]|nr:CDN_1a_G0005690.mRNA.1.CDS.1 [Saccharomyces cerevisiae]CAI7168021.1 CDN_1a_G0005690.mRNA.1.CDS.1 [Saccharomyces cerevisiae]
MGSHRRYLYYSILSFLLLSCSVVLAKQDETPFFEGTSSKNSRLTAQDKGNDTCPPCFNCMLPIFECKQFSECNSYTGRCECIEGFAGDDCSLPLCGGLSPDESGNKDRPIRAQNDTCHCDNGWGGINCDVCQEDFVCDAFMPDPSIKGTCYKNGMIVDKVFSGCNVTNEKILQILNGKIPQITFACDKPNQECNFQFWIDQLESFYCGLSDCAFEYDLEQNTSHYKCNDVQCKCVPDTMLCGAKGSIDISDFLTETIKGPGDFSCDLETRQCKFSEPSMNDLILTVFGDPYITLKCESGECVHYSEIPGYKSPSKDPTVSWQGKLVLSLTAVMVLALFTFATFYISKSPLFRNGLGSSKSPIRLPDEDAVNNFLQNEDDTLATLSFENITYSVPSINSDGVEETVLNEISGIVKPGQILAIMGGSGAGKTTLLDILAMKRKTGHVLGSIKVNGISMDRKSFSKIIGFVDQDDFLLPTLTVFETVLNSALLRLPKALSFEAKKARVYKVLEELRIIDIKDRIIGNEFDRGISGGEKRRVSIACELVTSPLVLFLDEPTSGLDASNANNVIECLVRLSSDYNRTLVLSIHQPRSNIFYLFDKLVLLSKGEMVYSGNAKKVSEFLRNEGYICPDNYNIADYLIDITFEAGPQGKRRRIRNISDLEAGTDTNDIDNTIHQTTFTSSDGTTQREWAHLAAHRDEIRSLLRDEEDVEGTDGRRGATEIDLNTKLLHDKYKDSVYYAELSQEIEEVLSEGDEESNVLNGDLPTGQQSAGFLQQLSILNSRSFKNMYRNPKLLLGNYLLTILLSLFLGTLYYNVSNDISGFQNRMGLFFFILTYFGFVTFTGLSSFALERIIFIKERSNNYYSPLAYYISKIMSEVVPLRVVPPILLSLIVYPMTGLNMKDNAFFKCIGILILFNLGISLEILTIGIIFEDLNNSIILSVLVLLGSLLFSGLFINTKNITNVAFKYLKNFSVFYYAYESLLINEVKTLMLKERKYGLNIEVPGATILSTFGFVVQNLVFDIKILALFNVVFLIMGYLALKWIVVEQK